MSKFAFEDETKFPLRSQRFASAFTIFLPSLIILRQIYFKADIQKIYQNVESIAPKSIFDLSPQELKQNPILKKYIPRILKVHEQQARFAPVKKNEKAKMIATIFIKSIFGLDFIITDVLQAFNEKMKSDEPIKWDSMLNESKSIISPKSLTVIVRSNHRI